MWKEKGFVIFPILRKRRKGRSQKNEMTSSKSLNMTQINYPTIQFELLSEKFALNVPNQNWMSTTIPNQKKKNLGIALNHRIYNLS